MEWTRWLPKMLQGLSFGVVLILLVNWYMKKFIDITEKKRNEMMNRKRFFKLKKFKKKK